MSSSSTWIHQRLNLSSNIIPYAFFAQNFTLLFTVLNIVAFQSKYFSYTSYRFTKQNNFLTPLYPYIFYNVPMKISRTIFWKCGALGPLFPPLGTPLTFTIALLLKWQANNFYILPQHVSWNYLFAIEIWTLPFCSFYNTNTHSNMLLMYWSYF